MQFPEDSLKLLGPVVSSLAPQAFYDRVIGFYQPRAAGGKAKEVQIKGKIQKTPTKKAPGTYLLMYQTAFGERTMSFAFPKEKFFPEKNLKAVCDHLLCSEQRLRIFLEIKKFKISACDEETFPLLNS